MSGPCHKKNSHATTKSKTYNLACCWLNASGISYIANKTASSYNSLAKSKYSEAHSAGEITDHVIQMWRRDKVGERIARATDETLAWSSRPETKSFLPALHATELAAPSLPLATRTCKHNSCSQLLCQPTIWNDFLKDLKWHGTSSRQPPAKPLAMLRIAVMKK